MTILILFAKQVVLYGLIIPFFFTLLFIGVSIPREYTPRDTAVLRVNALAAELCRAAEAGRIPANGDRQLGFSKFPSDLAESLRVAPAFSAGCDFHIVHNERTRVRISARGREDYLVVFYAGVNGPDYFLGWLDYDEPDTFYIDDLKVMPGSIVNNGRRCPNPFIPKSYPYDMTIPAGCSPPWSGMPIGTSDTVESLPN